MKYMDDFAGKPFSIEEDRRHDSKVRTGTNRAKRHLTAIPKAISQTTCPQYRKNRKQSEASCLPGLSLWLRHWIHDLRQNNIPTLIWRMVEVWLWENSIVRNHLVQSVNAFVMVDQIPITVVIVRVLM